MIKLKQLLLICINLTFLCSCSGDSGDMESAAPKKTTKGSKTASYDYSVYLENSGSLNGYLKVSGDSDFKANVYKMLYELNGLPQKRNLNVYDINTVLIPVLRNARAKDITAYTTELNTTIFRSRSEKNKGNQSKSDLLKVFATVLDSTSDHEVGILISDGVFSPGKTGNAQDYLQQQKSGIGGLVAEKLETQPIAILVLQFYSAFNGLYYYQDNSSRQGIMKNRPYYMICMGQEAALHGLLKKALQPGIFKGFRNYMFLSAAGSHDVSPRMSNNTDYYEYDPEEPLIVTKAVSGGRDGRFRLKIKLNLSGLALDAAYLEDPHNYSVSKDFSVEKITVSGLEGFTHELTLVAPQPVDGTVKLSLLRKVPRWIAEANVDSDKGRSLAELSGKTFGIRYLLEGLYDAYDDHPEYFSVSVSVNE